MSGIAKVFVVLILILSVFFFGTSATLFKTRTEWRHTYEQYKADNDEALANLHENLRKRTAEADRLEKENHRVKSNIDELSKDLTQTRQDLTASRATVAK